MKALSTRNPYALWIAQGIKTIETRTWCTSYRGPILNCSSAKPADRGPAGQALSVVNIVDCRRMTKEDEVAACCDLYPGAFSLVLADNRPLIRFPVKGSLGLWDYADYCETCGQMNDCEPSFLGDGRRCKNWRPDDSLFLDFNQGQGGLPLEN